MTSSQQHAEVTVSFNPYINNRVETHLEYTVYYESADGRTRWASGVLNWGEHKDPTVLLEHVLGFQTAFVRQQWLRVEVCIPNRDSYGWLRPGYIKDTGFLLATRSLH